MDNENDSSDFWDEMIDKADIAEDNYLETGKRLRYIRSWLADCWQ